jgi:hypothetical protein
VKSLTPNPSPKGEGSRMNQGFYKDFFEMKNEE